jgi:hypothetical protein
MKLLIGLLTTYTAWTLNNRISSRFTDRATSAYLLEPGYFHSKITSLDLSPSPCLLPLTRWVFGLFCRANTALLLIKMDHLCQHPQPLIYYFWHFFNSLEQCLKAVSYGSMKSVYDRLQRAYQTQARELYRALTCGNTSQSRQRNARDLILSGCPHC